ncbi:MAG TPA: hypothetical protein VEK06_03570 [Myxococcota bacterium]|nr:hypothetical protein [Myxococcota bacterium]
MLRRFIFNILIAIEISLPAFSWESHYLLSYVALKGMEEVSAEPKIVAETLDAFVKAEQKRLILLLKETELLSARTLAHYPPMPESLAFKAEAKKDLSLTKQFLMSLRLNPDIAYPLFVLKGPNTAKASDKSFSPAEIKTAPLSTLAQLEGGRALKKIMPGQKISALEIMATATEEPDHGMDFNLFANNNSWFGALYNFGPQPFGNPNLSYGTQAPFHMGFYDEPAILYMAANFLKQCYPEYRINQFIALSRFAFATGHPYWGYRFLGMANHYLQDLTQPYHARVAPDMSIGKLIGINALATMGYEKLKDNAIQILSNKHLALENYQFGFLLAALKAPLAHVKILGALLDKENDQRYGAFSDSYARMVVAKESYARAASIDAELNAVVPPRILDANFIFDGGAGVDLHGEITKTKSESNEKLENSFLILMKSFGSHTRQSVRYVFAN